MGDLTVLVADYQVKVSVIEDSAKASESISKLWSLMNDAKQRAYGHKKVVGLSVKKTFHFNGSGQLANFMCLPHVTFVGVGIEKDVVLLENDYGLQCTNFVGLSSLAVDQNRHFFQSFPSYGLSELASECGLQLLPHQSDDVLRCFQYNEDLSEKAIQYATSDAYATFYVGKRLMGYNSNY
ncbi:hypothetical protein ACFE04_028179 [Oxalis oulophora]